MEKRVVDVRGVRNLIRVTRCEWRGKDRVDIRLCYEPSPGFVRATKVGIILDPEQARQLRDALDEVLKGDS